MTETPLGLRTDHDLDPHQIMIIKVAHNWDLWFVRDRMVTKKVLPHDRVDRAIQECKRYLVLKALFSACAMLDDEADEAWHVFLLFTQEYQQFCEGVAGKFLHHAPFTTTPPSDECPIKTMRLYSKLFGVVPK